MFGFKLNTLTATEQPQKIVLAAMKQDYSEDYIYDCLDSLPDEATAGEIIVAKLLKGGKGHWGPYEHVQITLAAGMFPHSVMQQLRTHRVGVSFDCQSFRYTGKRIIDVVEGKRDIEEVFYLRPVGEYRDRKGQGCYYSADQREEDLLWCYDACNLYKKRRSEGLPEEQARSLIPFDARQSFVVSYNARSLLHTLTLRNKPDAQLEARIFSQMLFERFAEWMPHVAIYYSEHMGKKAKLSP